MLLVKTDNSPASGGEEYAHTTKATRLRVFIVSDVRLLRDGLALSLSQQPSLNVSGSADLTVAPTQIAAVHPDVMLLDVGGPGGLDLAPVFRRVLPDVKVVAIVVNDVEQEIFACAEARVSGFVSRNGSIRELVSAIHCAVRNELVCSPRIAALLFGRVATTRSERSGELLHGRLTRREHEIVSLLTQGFSNKEIARHLRIQNATVKNHVHSILGKLQLRRRGEVAARMERGFSRHRSAPAAHHRPEHDAASAVAPLD